MLEGGSQQRLQAASPQPEVFQDARWVNRFSRKKKQSAHPPKRFNHGCIAYGDAIYIMGGANTNIEKPLDNFTIFKLTVESFQWEILPEPSGDRPQPMSAFGCCLYEGTVLMFGGSNIKNESNNTLWQYTISSNTWRKPIQTGDIPSPRGSATALVLGHTMFLYGGICLRSESVFQEMYALDLLSIRWTKLERRGDAIPLRILEAGCVAENRIYISGGQHIQYEETAFDDLYEITMKGSEVLVRLIRTLVRPPARHSHTLTPLTNQYLVLIGGEGAASEHNEDDKEEDEASVALSDVWLFDRIKENWIKVEARNPIFKPHSNFTCVEHHGKLYIFGGLRSNNHLYDELLTLDFDMQKLATISNTRLCRNCHQLSMSAEMLPICEEMEMSFHYLQSVANLIKFPFNAFGLLIDNCVNTGATMVHISVLDRNDDSQDDKFIREEQKNLRSGILNSLKSPDRTVQYLVIEDNGRAWANEQFLRVVTNFETVNTFEYQVVDKKAKATLIRENTKREFGNNLKMGCIRLGKGFLYVSYLNNFIRVAMVTPKNRPGQEFVYVCYNYIEELPTGAFLTARGAENKAHILSVCRTLIKPNVLTTIQDRHKLYIFELRELQTKEGNYYELNSYRNDLIYGNFTKIEFLEKIGYNILECPDFSLRAYISLLYLKTETKIFLQADRMLAEEIFNQMFLEKIDKQKSTGFVKEIDYANEYTELAECKVVQLYYNPNIERRSNLFYPGVLIYHRNRLILRYKYELGQLFPLKFFKRKYKRTQNNVFQFFGFIELPDGIPYNFIKTEMQHHILMQGFLASLKLILKDIKRKLGRQIIDINPLTASSSIKPASNDQLGNAQPPKRQGIQRQNAAPAQNKPRDMVEEKSPQKEGMVVMIDKPSQNSSAMQIEPEKQQQEPPKPDQPAQTGNKQSDVPVLIENVPIAHIQSDFEQDHSDDDESSSGEESENDSDYSEGDKLHQQKANGLNRMSSEEPSKPAEHAENPPANQPKEEEEESHQIESEKPQQQQHLSIQHSQQQRNIHSEPVEPKASSQLQPEEEELQQGQSGEMVAEEQREEGQIVEIYQNAGEDQSAADQKHNSRMEQEPIAPQQNAEQGGKSEKQEAEPGESPKTLKEIIAKRIGLQ